MRNFENPWSQYAHHHIISYYLITRKLATIWYVEFLIQPHSSIIYSLYVFGSGTGKESSCLCRSNWFWEWLSRTSLYVLVQIRTHAFYGRVANRAYRREKAVLNYLYETEQYNGMCGSECRVRKYYWLVVLLANCSYIHIVPRRACTRPDAPYTLFSSLNFIHNDISFCTYSSWWPPDYL